MNPLIQLLEFLYELEEFSIKYNIPYSIDGTRGKIFDVKFNVPYPYPRPSTNMLNILIRSR